MKDRRPMDVYWLEQSEADVPPGDDWLGAREMARLAKLRFPKRRADWRLGRWTVKLAIAHLLRLGSECASLAKIQVEAAPSGAPEVLLSNHKADLTVSLSHRCGRCICAAATGDVDLGCDLEAIEPRSDAFLSDYFTLDEQALVTEAPADLESQLVTLLWSAKESASKALRAGLRLDTRSLNVVTGYGEQNGGWRPVAVRSGGPRVFQGWWCRAGNLIRTVVASPAPQCPVCLSDAVHLPATARELSLAERW